MEVMSHDILNEFDKLLLKLAEDKNYSQTELAALYPVEGKKYNHKLMVVGRSLNGWERKWKPNDLIDPISRKKVIDDIYLDSQIKADSCPMSWISDQWGTNKKGIYNTKKSAFFRVIHSLLLNIGVINSDKDWASYLVWSNLYKVAPASGGNPSSKLARIQFPYCSEILRLEINLYQPRYVLFLTGKEWFDEFSENIQEISITKTQDGLVERVGEFIQSAGGSSRIVVAKHPMGKKENQWVEEVLSFLKGD